MTSPLPTPSDETDDTSNAATNGVTHVVGAGRTMTRSQVAKRLGRSITSVKRYELAGRLSPSFEEGVFRFDRSEVDALAAQLVDEGDAEEPQSDLAVRTTGVTDMLASAHSHTEAAFGMLLRQTAATNAALLAENRRLSLRVTEAEAEAARGRASERETLDFIAKTERENRREEAEIKFREEKWKALAKGVPYLAPVFGMMVSKMTGAPIAPSAKRDALKAFFDGKTPEERAKLVRAVLDSDALSAAERATFEADPLALAEMLGRKSTDQMHMLAASVMQSGITLSRQDELVLMSLVETHDGPDRPEAEGATRADETQGTFVPAPPARPTAGASLAERKAWVHAVEAWVAHHIAPFTTTINACAEESEAIATEETATTAAPTTKPEPAQPARPTTRKRK